MSTPRLETRLKQAFSELGIDSEDETSVRCFLNVLLMKGDAWRLTYEHCMRVGLLSRAIGKFMGVDEKALFFAGILHDVGKCLTDHGVLSKTQSWGPEDAREMEAHVLDGFRMLRGRFDFSAEILKWHHQFQGNNYPKELPAPLHPFSKGTEVTISMYGRLLALADSYDALHRVNFQDGKVRKLSRDEIRKKMLERNPDQKVLVENLYTAGVFEK